MARRSNGTIRETDGGAEPRYVDLAAEDIGCLVRSLPSRLLERAAEVACLVNPVNAPVVGARADIAGVMNPMMIAVVTAKYWGPRPRTLTVSFMGDAPPELRHRILSHMNAWAEAGGINFVETGETGEVRIAFERTGYWSYVGTDILLIPRHLPTLNLQGFTMQTPESEYRRVVRHETGHTLGMPHEHMRRALVDRIDPVKAYAYFMSNFGWDKRTVNQQVLTPLEEATLIQTPPDQDSIMCYQLPGSITKDGLPIRGGLDINSSDRAFVGKIYPKPASQSLLKTLAPFGALYTGDDDWPESEDVVDVHITA